MGVVARESLDDPPQESDEPLRLLPLAPDILPLSLLNRFFRMFGFGDKLREIFTGSVDLVSMPLSPRSVLRPKAGAEIFLIGVLQESLETSTFVGDGKE